MDSLSPNDEDGGHFEAPDFLGLAKLEDVLISFAPFDGNYANPSPRVLFFVLTNSLCLASYQRAHGDSGGSANERQNSTDGLGHEYHLGCSFSLWLTNASQV